MRPIIIYGPTAVGKTHLALEIAKKVPSVIISMDSVLHYKGFNIGSAKPSPYYLKKYKHYFIDDLLIPEIMTVFDYVQSVEALIDKYQKTSILPIIVGGTMLYLKGLVYGYTNEAPFVCTNKYRDQLHDLQAQPQSVRFKQLQKIDPQWSKKIHANDVQRTIRGLLVYAAYQKPLSSFHTSIAPVPNPNYSLVAIECADRDLLRRQIKERTHKLFQQGLIDEVSHLMKQYPQYLNHPAFKSIGYREVVNALRLSEFDHLEELVYFSTSKFAKRQMTWMKRFTPSQSIIFDAHFHKKIDEYVVSILELTE